MTSVERDLGGRTACPDAGGRPATVADTPPAWFGRALSVGPEHLETDVEGVRIHYRAWGERDRPGVVLVHGGAAHSGWWDHIAPQLHGHRVIAPDLSGHGDSDRRAGYDRRLWAREILAVASAEGLDRPVVIGHSMGGWATVTAAGANGDALAGMVAIDSALVRTPPDEERLRRRRAPTRVYPTIEAAMERFVTLPAQDVVLPYVREHVARESLRRVEGGWTWKFDPRFFGPRPDQRQLLAAIGCPAVYLRCEHGLVDEEMAAEIVAAAAVPLPVVDLPASGHHPMLDQPLALVAALRVLLATWPEAAT